MSRVPAPVARTPPPPGRPVAAGHPLALPIHTIDHVVDEVDAMAIAAITVAELMVGGELADEDHRRQWRDLVDDLLSAMPIEPSGHDTARAHARLLAHVKRAGKPRGAHDLIIAATAVATFRAC